jgi:hypothetical protein
METLFRRHLTAAAQAKTMTIDWSAPKGVLSRRTFRPEKPSPLMSVGPKTLLCKAAHKRVLGQRRAQGRE